MNKCLFFLLTPFVLLGAEKTYYPYPGDVYNAGGIWKGVDHLANLSSSIPLQLDLIAPADAQLTIKESALFEAMEKVFTDNGFQNSPPSKGEHYFFHILVLVYPVNGGLAASIQGRLFEEVQVRRTLIEKDHKLQAETWDQSTLIVGPTDEFNDLLTKSVEGVALKFVKRLEAFQKKEQNSSQKSEETK